MAYLERSRIEASIRRDDFEQAAAELRSLLLWKPHDAQSHYLHAVMLRRSGAVDDFQRALATAESLGVTPQLADFQRRLLAVQQGNIDRAAEPQLLEQAAKLSSDDIAAQTYEAIGRGYLDSYRLKEAWQCLEYWTQWQPNTATARLMMADISVRTGLPAMALEQYRKILSFAPDSVIAQEKLAVTLLNLNEVNEAAEVLRQLCAAHPEVAQTWIELSEAERRLGNLDAARQAVQTARRQGVNEHQRGECFSILGQLSLAAQDPNSAVELLLAATELTPEDATAHHALGSALTLVGKTDLGTLHRQQAQRIREQYDQIQRWTRQVIERPDDLELRVNIGQALISQGLKAEGVRWLQTALIRDDNYAPAKAALDLATQNALTP